MGKILFHTVNLPFLQQVPDLLRKCVVVLKGTSRNWLGSDFSNFHNLFPLPSWCEIGMEEDLQSYVLILKVACSASDRSQRWLPCASVAALTASNLSESCII